MKFNFFLPKIKLHSGDFLVFCLGLYSFLVAKPALRHFLSVLQHLRSIYAYVLTVSCVLVFVV